MPRLPPLLVPEPFEVYAARVPPLGDDYTPYTLRLRPVLPVCQHCGCVHSLSGKKTRSIADVPYGDHAVVLRVTEGHTFCRAAKEYTNYRWPEEPRRQYTQALARYLARRMGSLPQRVLAERVGLKPTQVHRAQHEQLKERQVAQRSRGRAVECLGIDDLYIKKQRHMVAVDLRNLRLLALEPVALSLEGRADEFKFEPFFNNLPNARVVSLDMHAGQLKAAKKRWANATLVIDKRHILQLIDRDLLRMVTTVIAGRWERESDSIGKRQALRMFGAAAYPYLALRTLVLRRQPYLTPTDWAMWTLITCESQEGRQLWSLYQLREQLYDMW